jgi:hypothetical protein
MAKGSEAVQGILRDVLSRKIAALVDMDGCLVDDRGLWCECMIFSVS